MNVVIVLLGFLSFIPVIFLYEYNNGRKYKYLKYLMNAVFIWTILIFLEKFLVDTTYVYYIHLLGYPLKFLLTFLVFGTILNYIELDVPKWLRFTYLGIFFLNLGATLLNDTYKFMLDISSNEIVAKADIYLANNGPLFIYHVAISYITLIIAISILFTYLARNTHIRNHKLITRTMGFSVVLVLVISSIQVFFVKNEEIDILYIALVLFTFMLYRVIYQKDMIFNLTASGRGEILNHMREMYVLTDSDRNVVEISNLLVETYDINIGFVLGKPLDVLYKELEDRVFFYNEYDIEKSETSNAENKKHFHVRERKFSLKGMNEYGYMILIYDETKVFGLLRELNRLSNYDQMTGLHNRNYIETKIDSFEEGYPNLGILSLDLNGLKANNDYIGHERGDMLLKELAVKIKKAVTVCSECITSRIGGDEFLVIMPNTSLESLEAIKHQILESCDNDDIIDRISVSIGFAIRTDLNETVYDLIKKADNMMYEMKQSISSKYSQELVEAITKSNQYIR